VDLVETVAVLVAGVFAVGVANGFVPVSPFAQASIDIGV